MRKAGNATLMVSKTLAQAAGGLLDNRVPIAIADTCSQNVVASIEAEAGSTSAMRFSKTDSWLSSGAWCVSKPTIITMFCSDLRCVAAKSFCRETNTCSKRSAITACCTLSLAVSIRRS